jgi:imidazolonepropionase-like amidohydrolase
MGLGFNTRITTEWKGERPSTRMGAMAILWNNLIKAKKTSKFIKKQQDVDETDPVTEVFLDVISKKYKVLAHSHKDDDAMFLIQLAREFGLDVIANHCIDIYRKSVISFFNMNKSV